MKNLIRTAFIAVSLAAASGATLAKPQMRQAERDLHRGGFVEQASSQFDDIETGAYGHLALQEQKAAELERKERRLQRKFHPRHGTDGLDLT